jgi:putative photosynthetic complex assembly protein
MDTTAIPVAADSMPRGPLLVIGAVLLATLIGVAGVRWSGLSIHNPDASAALVRSLRFEDGPGGTVTVIDARSGLQVDSIHGEAGFLRGALRALARERRQRELGSAAPFELIGRADGRLTLSDPATGAHIDLESFGPTNAATFARLLTVHNTPASALPVTR